MHKLFHRCQPSPSMAVALIALTVALGGTSYAALKLPKNSVGSDQIRANAISGAKIRDGSLFANDFAAGQIPKGPRGDIGPQGPAGVPGTAGAQGATGSQGPPGVAQVVVRRRPDLVRLAPAAGAGADLVTMQLPAGQWSISAVTNGLYDGAVGATFRCFLNINGTTAPESIQAVALGVAAGLARGAVFAPEAAVSSAAPSTVVLRCNHEQAAPASSFGPDFAASRIVAIRADSLDVAAG